MAKQKQPDMPPKGAPLWMATWSDMMNLMFCFFVMLFAMSSIDAGKFDTLAASFSQTFSIFNSGGSAADSGGMMIGNGASQLNDLGDLFNSTGLNIDGSLIPEGLQSGDDEALETAERILEEKGLDINEAVAEKISEAISERNLDGMVDINFTSQFVLLTLSGALMFDSGSVVLKPEAERVLEQVGLIIQRFETGGTIQIEGHTDNVPMGGGGRYTNNEELSSGRALSVYFHILGNTSLDPARVVHAGRGEHNPVADNSTAEGRAMNRRVEIKLYNLINSP
ncbi:MAG: flagellar motor protein MotB [Lachnospiraceae bacterium]|nr:flagellar motor protein MotB [Lachnospiraceae bacterium]